MRRLKLLILIFCVLLSVPLGYFILRTYISLEQEESTKLKYFGETLFDQMELILSELVNKEERRSVDEYNPVFQNSPINTPPLSNPSILPYILGYIQNNPDGSFQTPIAETKGGTKIETKNNISPKTSQTVEKLTSLNNIFNQKRTKVPESLEISKIEPPQPVQKEEKSEFADTYLNTSRFQKQKSHLGQVAKRVEQITANQALNLSFKDQKEFSVKSDESAFLREEMAGSDQKAVSSGNIQTFQVEIAPMQSVLIDNNYAYIFRRIMIRNEIFRQGFIIDINLFIKYLAETYFLNQPMAKFTFLKLMVSDQGNEISSASYGISSKKINFSLNRNFPRPFSFLRATLTCDQIPQSTGRKTLSMMIFVLAFIIIIGLFAIYKSAKAVLDLSERKSIFVSSVTHELKTPLTNIRMYIEMLEQGIARTIEREQEYFRILENECSRLSRLINNVLEFSKLEQRKKQFNLKDGSFEDVLKEVIEIMQEKIRQEGFTININNVEKINFKYDREVMVQVLINLLENSMKFGKNAESKEIVIKVIHNEKDVKISVTDAGPGIPKNDIKKIFNDFYRGNNEITRNTGGAGIGLALVKRLIEGTGGLVFAENNKVSGCSINIILPKF